MFSKLRPLSLCLIQNLRMPVTRSAPSFKAASFSYKKAFFFSNKRQENFAEDNELKRAQVSQLQSQGKYLDASKLSREIIKESQELYQKPIYPRYYADRLLEAFSYFMLSNRDLADEILNEILGSDLEKSEEFAEVMTSIEAHHYKSLLLASKGDVKGALENSTSAFNLLKASMKDPKYEITLALYQSQIGSYQHLLLDFKNSEENLKQSLALLEAVSVELLGPNGDKILATQKCAVYEKLGVVYCDFRKHEESLSFFERGIETSGLVKDDNPMAEAQIRVLMANTQLAMANFQGALENLGKAEIIIKNVEEYKKIPQVEVNLYYFFAVLYSADFNKVDTASQYLEKALNAFANYNLLDWNLKFKLVNLKVDLLMGQNKIPEAEVAMTQLLEDNKALFGGSESDYSFYNIFKNFCDLNLYFKKDYAKALEYAWKAHNVASSNLGDQDETCGDALNMIAVIHYHKGQVNDSILYAEKGLDILSKIPHKWYEVHLVLLELSNYKYAAGDKAGCLRRLQEAKQLFESKIGLMSREEIESRKFQVDWLNNRIKTVKKELGI